MAGPLQRGLALFEPGYRLGVEAAPTEEPGSVQADPTEESGQGRVTPAVEPGHPSRRQGPGQSSFNDQRDPTIQINGLRVSIGLPDTVTPSWIGDVKRPVGG